MLDAKYIEKKMDEFGIDVADPVVKECTTQRVLEIISKMPDIPFFKITANKSQHKELAKQANLEAQVFNVRATKFAIAMLKEICILQAKLCRLEHGKTQGETK